MALDTFSFLLLLYSIIVALGLFQILTPIGHLIQAERKVSLYWVHSVWVLLIFAGHVFAWCWAWQGNSPSGMPGTPSVWWPRRCSPL